MERRYPKGVLLLLSNCKDQSREPEFNRWYDDVYLPNLMASGTFRHANRYRNTAPTLDSGGARYIAVLEADSEDLPAAMREFEGSTKGLLDKGEIHPTLEVVETDILRAKGPQFRSDQETVEVTGLMVLLSNCTDETKHEEFNQWYDTVHIPHVLETGRYHTVYRYESIDPKPGKGRYAAIYETDNEDPGELSAMMARERPQWIAKGLYFPYIERVIRGAYTVIGR